MNINPPHYYHSNNDYMRGTVSALRRLIHVFCSNPFNLVSQKSVKLPWALNSKSVVASRNHCNFHDAAEDFAPMQVNDTHIPWHTHRSPSQRPSRPRALNSNSVVASRNNFHCP